MNKLLTINSGNVSCVPHISKEESTYFLSFTDTSHQPPQANNDGSILKQFWKFKTTADDVPKHHLVSQ